MLHPSSPENVMRCSRPVGSAWCAPTRCWNHWSLAGIQGRARGQACTTIRALCRGTCTTRGGAVSTPGLGAPSDLGRPAVRGGQGSQGQAQPQIQPGTAADARPPWRAPASVSGGICGCALCCPGPQSLAGLPNSEERSPPAALMCGCGRYGEMPGVMGDWNRAEQPWLLLLVSLHPPPPPPPCGGSPQNRQAGQRHALPRCCCEVHPCLIRGRYPASGGRRVHMRPPALQPSARAASQAGQSATSMAEQHACTSPADDTQGSL